MPRRRRPPVALLALVPALVLAACGGSGHAQRAATDVAPPPLTSAQAAAPTTATTPTATTTTPPTTAVPTTASTTPPPSQTTTSPAQATGGAPAGCPGPAGGFIRDVQASGTDCGRARDVASGWFAAIHGGAKPDAQVTAAGYTCSGTLVGERATVTCAGPAGGKIAFTASP